MFCLVNVEEFESVNAQIEASGYCFLSLLSKEKQRTSPKLLILRKAEYA